MKAPSRAAAVEGRLAPSGGSPERLQRLVHGADDGVERPRAEQRRRKPPREPPRPLRRQPAPQHAEDRAGAEAPARLPVRLQHVHGVDREPGQRARHTAGQEAYVNRPRRAPSSAAAAVHGPGHGLVCREVHAAVDGVPGERQRHAARQPADAFALHEAREDPQLHAQRGRRGAARSDLSAALDQLHRVGDRHGEDATCNACQRVVGDRAAAPQAQREVVAGKDAGAPGAGRCDGRQCALVQPWGPFAPHHGPEARDRAGGGCRHWCAAHSYC
mmetsp:Transcript_2946/g.9255  ORF Transcript_2946/g.9255 Transcript_2946/m.9255 type:complete len:273 (+) Transcript_2946:576-1394(+)